MTLKETLIRDYNTILDSDSPLELSKALESTYFVLLSSPYKYDSEETKQIQIIRHISSISNYIRAKIDGDITDKESISFETTYSGLINLLKYL
jgi:hypothetical protein